MPTSSLRTASASPTNAAAALLPHRGTDSAAGATPETLRTSLPSPDAGSLRGLRRANSMPSPQAADALLRASLPTRPAGDAVALPAHALPLLHAAQGLVHALIAPAQARDAEVVQRLQRNTQVLLDKGIDTPEKLQRFLSTAWRHDAVLGFAGLGFSNGAGYMAGITAANEKLVSLLPPELLQNTPRLGFVVGLGVGALDVLVSAVGNAVVAPRLYNGPSGLDRLPAALRPDPHAEQIRNAGLAAGFNVAKNLPRVVEPFVQAAIEGRGDHSVNRVWADRIDASLLDGFGGMLAAGARGVHKLSQAVPYDARMLLRSDLGEVIDQTRRPWKESLQGVGSAALEGAKSLVTSPVPVAVVATVGCFITELFAANASIDRAGSPAGLPADRADAGMLSGKRASSVLIMGLMSGTIELGAPYAARGGAYVARTIHQGLQQTSSNLMAWAQARFGAAEPDLEAGRPR
ncbi:hypothetical protein C7Y68_09900 [Paracidovorax avenae]|uniref:hypothetical protein n=1 Tax=Paracidovorax avenae TaxID=80867 RepID=UPI000D171D35|nr:hypothetical protein [Paracidovorax avenae]AVS98857.1 hypothetical protein C8236_08470 [Paracidovorax avenae]AVT20277.1 hypothetical protein C7Y68_09900 [Paracidovorax avenae]